MEQKVYIVQRATGEVVDAKLTRAAAQSIAKAEAPCKVILIRANRKGAEDMRSEQPKE